MKKLVVYWKLMSMSNHVASKGKLVSGDKKYRVKQMSTEFHADTELDDAIRQLEKEYGARPPEGYQMGHKFAEYVSHTYVNRDQ